MSLLSDEAESEVLDLCGLKCPLSTLFARRALVRAHSGACITVIADDPLAAVDIPHMCHEEGFVIVAVEQTDCESRITIRKPDG